ncbi:hypothetical protein KAR48_16555 [bacterium]|nr:hypothetical protein [bacterium]
MTIKPKRSSINTVIAVCLLLIMSGRGSAQLSNIDNTYKWAWGSNIGWVNFNSAHGGVWVYDDHLEGYAYSESIGWIRMGTHTGGGPHTYANTAKDNYGVNRDENGRFSGYAWSTNAGWVNFNPTHGQVSLEPGTGCLLGYAWCESVGWIHFKYAGPSVYYSVQTASVLLSLTVFLQGPYNVAAINPEMTTNLAGQIPINSPYADGLTANSIPDGTTDWIYLELRSTADGAAIWGQSFLLKSDGTVSDPTAFVMQSSAHGDDANIELESHALSKSSVSSLEALTLHGVPAGDYFIIIRHRNHLAVMSATAQALSSSLATYDFTTGLDKYYGGDTALLESGVYGMFAGDPNCSSGINATDYMTVKNQNGNSGYYNEDCNLSGGVNATDYMVIKPNSGKTCQVQ